jgi:hypothetical protein
MLIGNSFLANKLIRTARSNQIRNLIVLYMCFSWSRFATRRLASARAMVLACSASSGTERGSHSRMGNRKYA